MCVLLSVLYLGSGNLALHSNLYIHPLKSSQCIHLNGGDETDGSPEREEEASSQPQVSDRFCYIWALLTWPQRARKWKTIDIDSISRTRPRTFVSAAQTVKAPIQSKTRQLKDGTANFVCK